MSLAVWPITDVIVLTLTFVIKCYGQAITPTCYFSCGVPKDSLSTLFLLRIKQVFIPESKDSGGILLPELSIGSSLRSL